MRPPAHRPAPIHACIGLLVLIAPVAPLRAQQAGSDAQAARRLDSVTVVGINDDARQVPAAVYVIDADTLQRARPQLTLSESLSRVPGVIARDRQNQAQDLQLSIRGFGARASFGVRGVRLYSDGIPATMPDGQGQVSHFALESAGRMEVLRGPYSALHGNAAGGVVAVFTRDAPAQPTFGAATLAGADDLWRASLSFASPLGREQAHSVMLDASRTRGDGYRDHGASERTGGQALLRGALGDATSYTLLFNALDLDAQDPQGLTAAQARDTPRAASTGALLFDTRKSVRQQQVGLRVEHAIGERHDIAATVWRGRRDTAQMLSVPIAAQANPLSGGGAIDLARRYDGLDTRWRWQPTTAVTLTLGAQVETAREHRRGFENFSAAAPGVRGTLRRDEDNRVRGQDLYAQLDWALHPRWRATLGLRRSEVAFRTRDRFITVGNPDDSGTRRYAATSPVAGVLFRARPWLDVFANAGRGFETPTFAELAYRGDGASGLNTALRPARSRSLEIGTRARHEGWDAAVTVFDTRTRDELAVLSSSGGRSVFGNLGNTRRQGVEASLRQRLGARWEASAAYAWIDAMRTDGRRIPGIARHAGWTELRWLADEDLDVLLQAQASSRIFADDANAAPAAGYARWDLGIEKRWRIGAASLRGFARIDNLFDRRAIGSVIVNDANGRYFEPAPGRTWLLGLRVERTLD